MIGKLVPARKVKGFFVSLRLTGGADMKDRMRYNYRMM